MGSHFYQETAKAGIKNGKSLAVSRRKDIGVLPRKEVELISLALHCSCTNLDEAGTRRQIRAALEAGATRDEILLVIKCGVALAVHSCSLGAPILIEEMNAAGVKAAEGTKPETPACDAMRKIGQWNTAWDPFYELSPLWTDEFFAFGASIYKSGVFTPRFMELISIAFDASITHMYAPGTLLIAEMFHVADNLKSKPLIYPVILKSAVYSLLLITFNILEETLTAMWHGQAVSIAMGGGSVNGILVVGIIMFVVLMFELDLEGPSFLEAA